MCMPSYTPAAAPTKVLAEPEPEAVADEKIEEPLFRFQGERARKKNPNKKTGVDALRIN